MENVKENNVSELLEKREPVITTEQHHLIKMRQIIDNCSEEEAIYVCQSLAKRYPLLMLASIEDRMDALISFKNSVANGIKGV